MVQRLRTRDTKQRRVVYETIRETLSHPTADWIFERVRTTMPKISLGTVYRNLSVLKDEGMVREIYGSDRRAHYDANTVPARPLHLLGVRRDRRRPQPPGARLARRSRSSSDARSPSSASSSPGVCAGCWHRGKDSS